jgi:ABC-type multidrug transport system ATPase subunit
MLTSLHINRFRSCLDVRLTSLTEVTALVGRNGAGKTNILQAFEWLGKVIGGDLSSKQPRKTTEPGRMSVEITLLGAPYWYSVNRAASLFRAEGGDTERSEAFEEELTRYDTGELIFKRVGETVELSGAIEPLLVGQETSTVLALLSLLPKTHALRSLLLHFWSFFTHVTYYPFGDLGDAEELAVIMASDFTEWEGSPRSWKSTNAQGTVMRIIKLSNDDPDKFEELKVILGSHNLDLIADIDVIRVPIKPGDHQNSDPANFVYFVDFTPSSHTTSFSFDKLSYGTKRIVQLVVSMLSDDSDISLIEQPEDGIHPALLHKLIPFMRNYAEGKQVIVASHSPAVLNSVEPEEIRLIEMGNGRTYARPLSKIEITAANNYLAKSGPLADFVAAL